MLVTLSFSVSAKIQPATISANATAVIRSSRDSGPISPSCGARGRRRVGRRAHARAGRATRRPAAAAGSRSARARDAVTSHLPKPMSSPKSRATCSADRIGRRGGHPQRGGDGEARHRAEHQVARRAGAPPDRRAASWRPAPPPARPGRGRRRAPCCSETPARSPRRSARCCRRARATSAPKRLTMNRLIRRPRPDLTTACATRNAITTSSTLALAKPPNACAGAMVPVSTTAATASIVDVSSGYAPDQHRHDGGEEHREQVPGRRGESGGNRREPDAEHEDERHRALHEQRSGLSRLDLLRGGVDGGWPTRTRPLRPIVRPCTVPSSASRTYCHVNS